MDQRNLLKDKPSRLKILDKKLYDEFTIIWNTDDLKRLNQLLLKKQGGD